MERTYRPLEIAFDILILLAALLVFVEEGAVAAGAAWTARRSIALAAALFDMLFTLEFAARLASASYDGDARGYLARGGWVDFAASVPLLVLVSGPFLFGLLSGAIPVTELGAATGSALGAARLLRALRLLRSLRLLRLSRVAPRLAGDSLSMRRNVGRAAALALATVLAASVAVDFLAGTGVWPDARSALAEKRRASLAALVAAPGADGAEAVAAVDADLLLVREAGQVVYTRYSSDGFRSAFGPDEIGRLEAREGVEAFFSLSAENRARAASSLASSFAAFAAFLAVLLGYGRYFREGVEAPVLAALAGLEGQARGTIVIAPPGRELEEPFLLLRAANRILPGARGPAGGEGPADPGEAGRGGSLLLRATAILDASALPTGNEELRGLLADRDAGRITG